MDKNNSTPPNLALTLAIGGDSNSEMDKNNSIPPKLALKQASGSYSKSELKCSNRDLGKAPIDDEYESSSGRDNAEAKRSGDDQVGSQPERKKQRHTPEHIEEMKKFFRENPHPNKTQIEQLSENLRLEPRQIRFWIQNHCAQVKRVTLRAAIERYEMENQSLKEAMKNCRCCNGGGPEMHFEVQQLLLENTILKNKLAASPGGIVEKSATAGLARAAMDKLIRMHQMEHLWISNPHDGTMKTLNHDEYRRQFTKPLGYRIEANRHDGIVLMNSMNLVDILMSAKRYAEMFPSIVSRATTLKVLRSGVGDTNDGQIQLMYMEVHVLSPLGPVRGFYFLRFCERLRAGVWAVVDVSPDSFVEKSISVNCKRQPSGLIIQELPGDRSDVTWIEHIDYDNSDVLSLYRRVVSSGLAFGSQRWLSALQHQCNPLALLMEINADTGGFGSAFLDPRGRQSLPKLAQRMMSDFCTSLCPSKVNNWQMLTPHGDVDIRVSTRKNAENTELPGRVVLCAATSVWLPVAPQKLLDFLRDLNRRSQCDMLSSSEPKQEIVRFVKGQDPRSSASLFASNGTNKDHTAFILQNCCTDAWGSIIVCAPLDIASMYTVMQGGELVYASVLPSGFVIHPDGPVPLSTEIGSCSSSMQKRGSILTVAFQTLLANMTTPSPAMEDSQRVQRLTYTLGEIRSSLILEDA